MGWLRGWFHHVVGWSFHVHENPNCTHSRKHEGDEVPKLCHSAGTATSHLFQPRYDVCTGQHTMSRNTQAMYVANNVRTLQWPAKSLYLNPIEHVLDLLKRNVRAQPHQLNLRELTRTIRQMWAAIPQHYLHKYIISMRTRCRAVIAAAGSQTKY